MTHKCQRADDVKPRRLRRAAAIAVGITASLFAPIAANAQDSRADIVRQEQTDRQRQLSPPQLNGVERLIERLEDWGLIDGAPRGFYPWFGSVYPGGGVAAGAGVRKAFRDDGALNVFGGYSVSTFSRAQADLALPTFASNRARITVSGTYIDAPDVQYFGVGNSSVKEDKVRFGYTPSSGGTRLDVDVSKFFSLGGGVQYHYIETSGGKTTPSIEERFSAADTPGLELSTFKYINSTARAVVDWRRLPGYTGRGGLYRVQFDDFHEQNHDLYSFRSVEAEAVQLIPILRANWVIAVHGLATITDIEDTSVAPFFMLPSLGGGTTLRGYQDFRFRDRNRLLLNAELRWTPARFMDMAIFYDTGKVTSRREDLDFDDLKESYGIGMRLIGVGGYVFRVEAAHSRENNVRLIFTAGGAF